MNNYLKTSFVLVLTLFYSANVLAEGSKIGFVNPILLLDKAPQTISAKEKVEREFKSRDNELVGKQKELRRQEEKLKRDGSTLSSSARQKLESKIGRMRREIKRDLDDFREDFTLARNREMVKLQKRINEAIIKLAKDENYDLIVGDSIIYASDKIDVTDKVIKLLKADFKKNAGK